MEKKKNRIIVFIAVAVLICIIGIAAFFALPHFKDNNSDEPINETGVVVDNASISFANMKLDNKNLKLSDEQKEVLKYFDNDYFYAEYDNLQRYPKIYEGAQIQFYGNVKKIIKSTDTEYEILFSYNGGTIDSDDLVVLKGEQRDKRIIEGDSLRVYGRYMGIDTYEVDSTSYTIPTFNVFNAHSENDSRFDMETINNAAKCIFGNDIKLSEFHDTGDYLVTLDNQSNDNFKSFVFYTNISHISDSRDFDAYYNEGNTEPPSTERNLYISADLENFIITVFDHKTHIAYLEYYDKSLTKKWSREFSNVDTFNMDYTSEKLALAADNDLYFIDMTTGEDLITPVMVGKKAKVNLVEDGVILIGSDKKDMVMKIDLKGNIVWKTSSKYDPVDFDGFYEIYMQIIDGKYVIAWNTTSYETAYLLLDKDGNIELETDVEEIAENIDY